MLVKLNFNNGGSKINGIIQEYMIASGGNVNAGDFVTYINKFNENKQTVQISAQNQSNEYANAIQISDDRVLIAHTDSAYNKFLNVVICKIDNNGITIGNDTLVSNWSLRANPVLAMLNENKVVISFLGNDTSYIYGVSVITINNLEIISKSYKLGLSVNFHTAMLDIVRLNENEMYLIHNYGTSSSSSNQVYGLVLKITDNEVTYDNYKMISADGSYAKYRGQLLKLNEKTLVAFLMLENSSYNRTVYIKIINYENNILSYQDATSIVLGKNGAVNYVINLGNNRFFLSYADQNKSYLNIYQIDNLTLSTIKNIERTDGYNIINHEVIDSNKVSLYTLKDNNLYIVDCLISDNVTFENELLLSTFTGYYKYDFLCFDNKVFFTHSPDNNTILYATLLGQFNNGVAQLTNSSDAIFGVAKEKGTSGSIIKVYVPKIKGE